MDDFKLRSPLLPINVKSNWPSFGLLALIL